MVGTVLGSVRRAAILGVAVALFAAPTVHGAQPTRTVIFGTGTIAPYVEAGFGCAFDVALERDSRITTFEFSDGRTVTNANARPLLVNIGTGATVLTRSVYHAVDTYDPATNDAVSVTDGRFNLNLYPGDVGPYGVVDEPGLFVSVIGHMEITFDLDTGTITTFRLDGRVTVDLCAELSD